MDDLYKLLRHEISPLNLYNSCDDVYRSIATHVILILYNIVINLIDSNTIIILFNQSEIITNVFKYCGQ